MDRIGVRMIVVAVALAVAACGDPAPSPPSDAPLTQAPAPTAIATATPQPSAVPTLTVAIDGDLAGGLSNAARGTDAVLASGFIHDGLYALDERLRPVPRLAQGPATVSADGLTWTVRLRDGVRFHDGSTLTADDVVQTYEIARSPRCRFGPDSCLSEVLDGVSRVDDRTVAFRLRQPVAGLSATALGIGIESKAAIDAAYATWLAGVSSLSVTETSAYLAAVAAEEADPTGPAGSDGRATIDHAGLRAPGEALLTRASVDLPDPADHTTDGTFDEAAYVLDVAARVRAIDATFTSRPIDALAAAYPYLAVAKAPVGTGPFRYVAGTRRGGLELAANRAYFLGAPEIQRLELRVAASASEAAGALANDEVDWWPGVPSTSFQELRDDPDVRFAEYPEFGFLGLTFNLHPEADGLFLDRNVRQAIALCMDKEATVAAATNGDGTAIYSEIPTMSWAYPMSGLATYPPDRTRAVALIEESGWERGSDGVYEKDGRRLSTVVPVREGYPARTDWLRRVSEQVRGCGVDLQVEEVSLDAILEMLAVYPHVNAAAPDDGRPFDAYFGGLDTGVDPDPFRLYHSSECSSAERPDTFNFGCYQSEDVDRLIEAARTEVDTARRAELYQDYAVRLSEDLPVIYAWSDLVRDGIGASVDTTAPGGLQLDTPTWYRPVERLTNVR